MKRGPTRPLLLLTAALVLVVAMIAVERASRPAPGGQGDRGPAPDLSRAMTFMPPAEPKR